MERPAYVPDEELADTTRWLIRNLVEVGGETDAREYVVREVGTSAVL